MRVTVALRLVPVAALIAGCGATITVPTFPKVPASAKAPSTKPSNGAGDTADFFFDPEHVWVTQSGRIQINAGVPALRYSGPLGCRGRTFEGDVTADIEFVFRYGARDAWLGWSNGNIWHFTHRPKIAHGSVTFAQRFSDGRQMVIVVHCPPPPRQARL
jgi:hypothetical protein